MHLRVNEYHPEAACGIFKGTNCPEATRAALRSLVVEWFDQGVITALKIVNADARVGPEFDFDPKSSPEPLFKKLGIYKNTLSLVNDKQPF